MTNNIKLGWGMRILLLYLGFVALIATLVTRSIQQDFDLVSDDYYNEELKYQQVIDASKNQAALSSAVILRQQGQEIYFTFPAEQMESITAGKAVFYSHVNAAWDKTYALNISNGQCTIPTGNLAGDSYVVKLEWQAGNKTYYQQNTVRILR